MEADAYERVTAALSDRTKTVKLPVPYPPGIDKIVWSVWDYILGPDLKFTWDVVPEDLPSNPRTASDLTNSFSGYASSNDSATAKLEYDDDEMQLFRTSVEVYACGRCGSGVCLGNCQMEVSLWPWKFRWFREHSSLVLKMRGAAQGQTACCSMAENTRAHGVVRQTGMGTIKNQSFGVRINGRL